MQEKIRIENLQESNIEDLIYVCSSKRLDDPIHQQGIRLKKQLLKEMLDKYDSCAKTGYYNGKPVAQILYYPEEAIKRKNQWLIVNAKPIQTFFMETEKFKEEIKQAVNQNP